MYNKGLDNKNSFIVSINQLGIICLIVLCLLALLSLFNHPTCDDYIALNLRSTQSLGKMQITIFNTWGGRYTSNFFSSLFTTNNFLFKWYFVHTFFLLVASLFSIFYFIITINKIYFDHFFLNKQLLYISAFILITIVFCLSEINTALYWFSSSITYQFSFCCLLFFLGLLITFLNQKKKSSGTMFCLILLIIIINGTNELTAILNGVICVALLVFFRVKRSIFLTLGVAMYIASLYISLHSCGNQIRLASIASSGSSFLSSIVSLCFQILQILQSICSSLLFLFSIFFGFVLGQLFQFKTGTEKPNIITLKTIYKFLLYWLLVVVVTLFPLLFISKGSFPLRALNVLVAASILYFISIAFYVGMTMKILKGNTIITNKNFIRILGIIFCVVLFFNQNFVNLITSFIAAPSYNIVLNDREKLLEKKTNTDTVFVYTINQSLNNLLETKCATQKQIIKKIIIEKPKLLFFEDDMETEISRMNIAKYYHINTLLQLKK